jgi:hypothetical protein
MNHEFKIGDRVKLVGPESSDYTGRRGTIVETLDETASYPHCKVRIDGREKPLWFLAGQLEKLNALDLLSEV